MQFFREHIQGTGCGWDPYREGDGHSNPRGQLHSLPHWVSVRMKGTGRVRVLCEVGAVRVLMKLAHKTRKPRACLVCAGLRKPERIDV